MKRGVVSIILRGSWKGLYQEEISYSEVREVWEPLHLIGGLWIIWVFVFLFFLKKK